MRDKFILLIVVLMTLLMFVAPFVIFLGSPTPTEELTNLQLFLMLRDEIRWCVALSMGGVAALQTVTLSLITLLIGVKIRK